MKKLFLYGGFGLAIGLSCCTLQAADIIKTAAGSLSYFDQLQIFKAPSNTVQGWVRLNRGFAVGPSATAYMDTFITVSGPIDLGETGLLVLNGNLFLDKTVTLTSGGNIKGKPALGASASTIFLGGDLILSATTYSRVLHITGDWSNSSNSGDLIIDGMGHTLDIQDRAQIFVDTNITLTLRNMTIRTGPKSLNVPAIQLASHGSKLALDNVMFDLGTDFVFKQGQIFIHDEVAVTGTSAFVYTSPKPSYITSGATWSFEEGTTFSVAPSTFTDCPFTLKTTYTNNAFIVLADASSAVSLNGCAFKTTVTGLRLTRGMVLFDNQVPIDTRAGVDLGDTPTSPVVFRTQAPAGTNAIRAVWSPDGRFLAEINSYNGAGGNSLQIYRFDGNTLTYFGGAVPTGQVPYGVAWSPDGRFIAVINQTSNTLQIYRFNGASSPTPVGTTAPTDLMANHVTWSPDGKFLAVSCSSSATLKIYSFNGTSAPTLVGSPVFGPAYAEWSPDGRYIAVLDEYSLLQVYRFDGRGTPSPVGASVTTDNYPHAVAWSPDGRFLAVAAEASNPGTLGLYRFDGSTKPVSLGTPLTVGSYPNYLSWSPNGKFIAVLNQGSGTFGVCNFNGSNKLALLGSFISPGGTLFQPAWSPDGNFLALVLGQYLLIYRSNFVSIPTYTQGFTNGLVFGDSAKGSNFDATVKIMGNARVGIKGKVTDDSA